MDESKLREGFVMEFREKFEIKVFILFLLNNLSEPLEFPIINDIVIQDGFVNYFDFSICFAELLEAGQITETSDDKPLYAISESGKTAIESYEGSIYNMVREKALRSTLRLLAFNRSGNKITSNISESNGGYIFSYKIQDNQRILFAGEVFVTELYFAEKLKANFDERAEIIYKGTLALLSGDVNFIFDE